MTLRFPFKLLALGALLAMPAAPGLAATCGTGSFEAWLNDFKNEAAGKGISQSAIASGLNGVTLDQAVLSRDRSQKVFSQSFEEFLGRMVPPRLTRGANMLKQYGSVLGRIEQSYGVPGEILVARARVLRSGRTLKICVADVFVQKSGTEIHCATMLATIMCLPGKSDRAG